MIYNTREDIKDLRRIIKDLTVTKEIFRYRDWVNKLIQEIVRKLDKLEDINGASAWDIISYEFSIMIKYDHEKIKDEENIDHFSPDAREYIKPLKKILDKVNISLGEFVLLMKFKWTSNDEFHVWRYQTVLKELMRLSFPKDLECFMDPSEKAIRPLQFNYCLTYPSPLYFSKIWIILNI